MLTRRRLLQSSSLLAFAPTVPSFLARTARAAAPEKDRRVLVVVQLDGGNDALNTVVPHSDPAYKQLRPNLRVEKKDLIGLSETLGLHPSLQALGGLLHAGHLAVVPGVGYPNPNRSHFADLAIWHTARFDPEERKGYGWLGRALDSSAGMAYAVGDAVPGALRSRRSTAVALRRVEDLLFSDPALAKAALGPSSRDDLLAFVQRQAVDAQVAADKLARLTAGGRDDRYPGTRLGERLGLVARLLKSGLGARVFYTLQSGYDTHASQMITHANLLYEFAGAVTAFFEDLGRAKLADRVTLLAFSEFGRSIQENASAGTDHGTAGVLFVAGPGVRGGVMGDMPSLTDLEDGEPKMTTDFRRVYAAVLADWLGLPPQDVLGGSFERLPVFRHS